MVGNWLDGVKIVNGYDVEVRNDMWEFIYMWNNVFGKCIWFSDRSKMVKSLNIFLRSCNLVCKILENYRNILSRKLYEVICVLERLIY